MSRLTTKQAVELRMNCCKSAREEAENNLAFVGDAPFRKLNLSVEQETQIKKSLIYFAETGAVAALHYLQNHAHVGGAQ